MNHIYLGIKGKAVCVDKNSGDIIWETTLKATSSVTNIYLEDNKLFAYSGGHLFCLNKTDGTKLWENELKGFGYGPCIIASENQDAAQINAQLAAQQAAAAAVITASTVATTNNSGG